MVAGMASRGSGSENVTIRFVERFFGHNPLAGLIFPVATEAAEAYAVASGRQKVKIKAPVAGAVPWYEANGFRRDRRIAGVDYLSREVL